MRRLAVAMGIASLALPAGADAATYVVKIVDMAFGPVPAKLRVGDVIEWRNTDIFEHTATASDGQFDVRLLPKGRGRSILRAPGRVSFYCRYHPGMQGVLLVSP